MHPATAARLVRRVSTRRSARVLDPFCGSGTVLVEAMIAGRRAIGTDLNPLAVRLARLKTARARRRRARRARRRSARRRGLRRRAARSGAPAPRGATRPRTSRSSTRTSCSSSTRIRAGIASLDRSPPVRGALALVLSAILVKLSRRASDTSTARAPSQRRIGRGLTRRASSCARRRSSRAASPRFEALCCPRSIPPAHVALDDAARLRTIGASTVDAVVTSPPYVATYDYLAHHALRLRWLDLDTRPFASGEIGSRRRYAPLDAADARDAWKRELGAALRAMSRVCRKGAPIALLLADSAVRGEALRADVLIGPLAAEAGLVVLARASQARPHFHGPTARAFQDAPRAEHAIALEKR